MIIKDNQEKEKGDDTTQLYDTKEKEENQEKKLNKC